MTTRQTTGVANAELTSTDRSTFGGLCDADEAALIREFFLLLEEWDRREVKRGN